MSTASMPVFHPNAVPQELPPAARSPRNSVSEQHSGPVRRRLDRRNGQALEQIGHAIEYLIDNRTFPADQSVDEAIAILSRASRAVFAECPAIIPRHRRLSTWLRRRLSRARAEHSIN